MGSFQLFVEHDEPNRVIVAHRYVPAFDGDMVCSFPSIVCLTFAEIESLYECSVRFQLLNALNAIRAKKETACTPK